jgi:gamma-glutamyltranspeptidase / glutathione hydrolase
MIKFRHRRCTIPAALVFLAIGAAPAVERARVVVAKHGLVVSVCPHASRAGRAVLEQGGNAVDAAIATAFALAVTHPAAGNIGGGGFMLVHPAPGRGPVDVVEYRETAPAAAMNDMFANGVKRYSHQVVGVPGTVRGLEMAYRRHASKKLTWKQLIEPAIELASAGFVVDEWLANSLNKLVAESAEFTELCRVFGQPSGPWRAGDRLTQPDLAQTLRLIGEQGADAFYSGSIADLIVAEMKSGGGLITKTDLAAYQAKAREPIHGTYRGFDVWTPPPPSSGGICLVETLNILENFELKTRERFAPETLHLMAEAMRRGFCDRARYLGDPDFVSIPRHLTTKEHAATLAAGIDPRRVTPSTDLAKDLKITEGTSDNTTHFSVIDRDGMAVANTYTLEHSYGSKVVVRGGGFLLNNEMMDFNHKPGVTSRNGGIGTPANEIAPGKRMLSSQTPTILAKDGRVRLVTGSPGSRTIINTVCCIVVNVVDYDMDVGAAVDAPRIHHQWFPDELRLERSPLLIPVESKLKALGHTIKRGSQGDAHTILVDPATSEYRGAADTRLRGGVSGY